MNKNAFMGGNVQWEYGKKLRCYHWYDDNGILNINVIDFPLDKEII